MEEAAELEKQRPHMVVTQSSIKRKPFANLTNIIRKPNLASSFSQSKRPGSSPASDSSVGTTQSRIHVIPPDHSLPSDHLVGDGNRIACAPTRSTQKTRSNVKAAVQETKGNGKGNQSPLDKTTNDGKEKSVVLQCSSMEKIKDKRKAIDVPFIARQMKNAKTNTDTLIPRSAEKINNKGKENSVQSNYSAMKNTNSDMSFIMPPSLKRKDKGKEIAVPLDYPPMKKVKNSMVEIRMPLSGVKIKDRGETVMGSSRVDLAQKDEGKTVATPINYCTLEKKDKGSRVDLAQKDEGKAVATPINYHTLEKKDKGSRVDLAQKDEGKAVATPINYRTLEKKDKRSSCPPLLRTTGNRNEVDGAEDAFQSNAQTDPPLDKKKKRCSSTKGVKEYALPHDFVEQQRAYFKEIDEFELQVEEV